MRFCAEVRLGRDKKNEILPVILTIDRTKKDLKQPKTTVYDINVVAEREENSNL